MTDGSVAERIRQLAAAIPMSEMTPPAARLWNAIADESAQQSRAAVAARIRAAVTFLGDEDMALAAQARWRDLADSIAG